MKRVETDGQKSEDKDSRFRKRAIAWVSISLTLPFVIGSITAVLISWLLGL